MQAGLIETLNVMSRSGDNTEYEREMLYGLVSAYAFGSDHYLHDGDFYFRSPYVEDGELDASSFLYAIRKPGDIVAVPSKSHLATPKRTTNVKQS